MQSNSPSQQNTSAGTVSRTFFLIGLILALLAGIGIGRFIVPAPDAETTTMRKLSQSSPLVSDDQNARDITDLIAQHEEAVKQNPGNAEAWVHLGNMYYDIGEAEKSVHAYEKSLALVPDNPDVLTDCGVMYRELHQFDKALEYFAKAIQINPKHQYAYFNSGVILFYDLNRPDEAFAIWEKLLEINPQAAAANGTPLAEIITELKTR